MGAVIQTRLTSDNRQHDECFKRSKQQVYNYNKQVDTTKKGLLKFAKGGLGQLGLALGVAGGAMQAFTKTMRATQTTSDAFDNAMAQAKASVNYFFTSLSRGDFSSFLDGLGDVITKAKEAQKALDNLGTATLLTSNAGAKYARQRAELERTIKTTTDPNVRKNAQAELERLPDVYAKELEKEAKNAQKAFLAKGREVFGKVGFATPSDKMLEEFFSGNEGYDFWTTVYSNLKEINDEDLKAVSELYRQAQNIQASIDQLYTQNVRLMNYGGSGSGSSTTSKPQKERADNLKWMSGKGFIGQIFDGLTQTETELDEFGDIVYEKMEMPLERVGVTLEDVLATSRQYASEAVDRIESADEQAQRLNATFQAQLDTIHNLAGAFGALGDATGIKGFNVAGIIAEAVANIVKGYATASAESATAGPWAWAAFSAAGLAQVISVISQIHSLSGYATGGIVGGTSYTGDRVLARVNSGEMILNPTQQANLFSMLNTGGMGSGEVKFRIDGTTLVGVLNNYNSKSRRVM